MEGAGRSGTRRIDNTGILIDYRYIDYRQGGRLVRGTFWLRCIAVVLNLMLVSDVAGLLLLLLNRSGTVGTVSSADIFAGEPYQNRMHQELRVDDVFVSLTQAPTTAQRVLYAVSHGVAFCLVAIPMLILARRLIAGVLAEDPFTQRTVRRLRVLGTVVLAGGALSELAEYVTAHILFDSAVAGPLRGWSSPDFHLSLWWLLPGLIL